MARVAMTWRWGLAVCLLSLAAGAGCKSAPQSTRLSASDFDVTTNEMIARLAGSDFLRGRTADSPPMIVVIDKVRNQSSDVLSTAEMWMFVARVADQLQTPRLAQQANISFQITPERFELLRKEGYAGDLKAAPHPTHVMTATFLSAEAAGRSKGKTITNLRSDRYYLEYSIIDLATREPVWTDRFEFQRVAKGNIID